MIPPTRKVGFYNDADEASASMKTESNISRDRSILTRHGSPRRLSKCRWRHSMLARRRSNSLCQGALECNFLPQCVGNFRQTMSRLGMGVEQQAGDGCYVQPAPTPLGIGNGVRDLERQRKRGHPRISMPPWFIRVLMVSADPVFRVMPSRFLCHAEKSPAGVPAVVTKRGWGAVRFRQLVKRRTHVGRPSVQY